MKARSERPSFTFRRRSRLGRRVVVARLLMIWVFIVSLFFLWEADRYTGLYALLAEWQFNRFGHYLPILTFALLVIVFGSPAAWLLRARRHADRRDMADRHGREAAVRTSANFRRTLFGFSGGLAGAALVTLLFALTLPRMSTPRAIVSVGGPQSAKPRLGPVVLRGQILYTRTSAFAQNLLIAARGVRFAPIVAQGDAGVKLRYFVELLPGDYGPVRTVPLSSVRSGVLMRNSLPGSIVRLYRYAGYDVETPYYVLYESTRTLRWPYYLTAAQLAIAALIAFIMALFQHRHVVHISDDQDAPPGAGAT
ncbi:MAG TPA: hypothetical protein VFQ57_05405 [Sphingomonas sp.]|jgi:hypothetical protein|nr:hypothetical protein [Sphingomonas sp.]